MKKRIAEMKSEKFQANNAKITFIKMKWVVILGAVLFFSQALPAHDFYVISDPSPTVKEDKIVYLEEVRSIDEDLGNGQYLFYPRAITANKSFVWVYDAAQAKVFRFSPDLKPLSSFGRKGPGPHEFSGTGRGHWVEIAIGGDGNFYANDASVRKMIGLDMKGKHLKTFIYGDNYYSDKPVVDKNGNILYVSMKDGEIQIYNEKIKILHRFPSEKAHHGFLFEKPTKLQRKIYERQSFAPESSWILTMDSKLLIFFKASSTLAMVNENGYVKTLKLWPRELLQEHKKKYRELRERRKDSFMPMFGGLIIDQDNKDIFYLQAGGVRRKQKIAALLYAFNLEGRLLNVIRVPTKSGEEEPGLARMCAKVNDTFYAIRGGEEVVLYKENK
jgi:hypothetical protein